MTSADTAPDISANPNPTLASRRNPPGGRSANDMLISVSEKKKHRRSTRKSIAMTWRSSLKPIWKVRHGVGGRTNGQSVGAIFEESSSEDEAGEVRPTFSAEAKPRYLRSLIVTMSSAHSMRGFSARDFFSTEPEKGEGVRQIRSAERDETDSAQRRKFRSGEGEPERRAIRFSCRPFVFDPSCCRLRRGSRRRSSRRCKVRTPSCRRLSTGSSRFVAQALQPCSLAG